MKDVQRLPHHYWLHLCLCVASAAGQIEESLRESCLLQQRSSSQRSSQHQVEDRWSGVAFSKRQAPKEGGKSAPKEGGKTPGDAPKSDPKTAPDQGGKQAPKPGGKIAPNHPGRETTTTTTRAPVVSTPVEVIKETPAMSQRGELHFTMGLGEIQEKYGTIDAFAEKMRAALLADIEEEAQTKWDPKQLVFLGAEGEYLSSTGSSSGSGDRSTHVSRLDFELFPGPPGSPCPGKLIKKLAMEVRDQLGEINDGGLKEVMEGAALVVVEGTKKQHSPAPSPSSSQQSSGSSSHPHSSHSSGHHQSSSHGRRRKPVSDKNGNETTEKDNQHGHHSGGGTEKHNKHGHHSGGGSETGKEIGYPWQWFGSGGKARMRFEPLLLLTCFLALGVTFE